MINYRGRQCERLRRRIAKRAHDRLVRALNKALSTHARGESLMHRIIVAMEVL